MSDAITPGYGRMLAEAREAKAMTVAQVAEKLKLTTRQIEALEAEDATRLPAVVFVRGFIRNYARLVDLPLDSLPAVAEAPVTPTETITAHSEELRFNTSPVRRWLLLPMAVLGLFLVLVAILYAWLSQGEEAYVPAAPAVTSQPVPLPVPAPIPVAPPVSMPAPPAEATSPTAPAATPVGPAAPAVPPQAAPAPVPATGVTPSPAEPAKPGRVVQLTADQVDAWIEVISGDDKRYTRLLRTGEQLTLRGMPPFRLVVGNAATVRLSYDGRAIDLKPYTGDKVARLTLE